MSISKTFIMLSTAALLFAPAAFAQTTDDTTIPGHPRVNEVDQRLDNQQNRINNGVADGKITAAQAAKDTTHDTNVADKLSADQAKDGGHITKKQDKNLNKRLNKNSTRIKKQKTTAPAPAAQ